MSTDMNKNELHMPIMLFCAEYENDSEPTYVPINSVSFITDRNVITQCYDSNYSYDYLISTDGSFIKIEDLNCKTYDELLIALEIHGLLHGMSTNGNEDKSAIKELFIENSRLKEENEKLKKKLSKLKKLFND